MIRSTLWRTLCALPLLILPATVFGARPNFIVIMADDIGFGDVSAYGSKALRTPNIDRLAAEGVPFTSGYCSASTCTPTRYSFRVGRKDLSFRLAKSNQQKSCRRRWTTCSACLRQRTTATG